MSYHLSEEQKMIRAMVRDFARDSPVTRGISFGNKAVWIRRAIPRSAR